MWTVTIKVGVFWDGPEYPLGKYPWRWLADLRARLHLVRFPYRTATISPHLKD